jgi:TonB family protein
VASVLAGRFEEAVNAGRFEEAAQTLANFKSAAPADARVATFEQRFYAGAIAKALADGNLERAVALVRQAQQAGTTAPEQLAKWRADIARRAEDSKVTRLSGLVADRIREGKLTDPEDSAKIYLQQLQAAAPTHPATQRAVHDLGGAYLRKARDAALAKNSVDEDRWLNEARASGMKTAEIAAFQRDLSTTPEGAAGRGERELQLARERLRDGRPDGSGAGQRAANHPTLVQTNDPNNAFPGGGQPRVHRQAPGAGARGGGSRQKNLPTPTSPRQALRRGRRTFVPCRSRPRNAPRRGRDRPAILALAANLKRLRSPSPDYPQSALAQKISGSVTLQFTVSTSGEPRDVRVVEATPPGVFDSAAMNAIRHWRYAPTVINGTPVEVPVRTLMRFELPK